MLYGELASLLVVERAVFVPSGACGQGIQANSSASRNHATAICTAKRLYQAHKLAFKRVCKRTLQLRKGP